MVPVECKQFTVLNTTVGVEIGDRKISVQFTVSQNAADNRTFFGIDFLEKAGIVLNLAQQTWSFIEYPMMQYKYNTADSQPNAITNIVQKGKTPPKKTSAATAMTPPIKTVAATTQTSLVSSKRKSSHVINTTAKKHDSLGIEPFNLTVQTQSVFKKLHPP